MNHNMSLYERPFELIKAGSKSIEIRCNDEKRQRVKTGDTITFGKLPDLTEHIVVEVLDLYPFSTFEALYRSFDFAEFGCEGRTMEEMLSATRCTYSAEKEEKYGALGIRVRLAGV